ncbi:hypothetical protein CFHF_19655 [Caulobacter flavus]|uniref:HTH cro/C1-type domain-containing protein n=1 Tax=Caulobacter flavus TaxID=1679497 RepID=A0A2N5CNZ8_9CAUL|nr:helix-turn-helix transcriptional regulator [Caulobacter flavus]AYV48609.1 hypothetical protein C1707_21410 [Caulobacter flavus]PLR08675.1 hypothetical protein CFHF_19655 [Caulobacter flavus]
MARLEEQVGAIVRHHRTRAGLTQAQLAELIDRQPGAVQNIENGKAGPTFETIVRLVRALNINAVELFQHGDFVVSESANDTLVEILQIVSALGEPELIAVKALIEAGLDLRRA